MSRTSNAAAKMSKGQLVSEIASSVSTIEWGLFVPNKIRTGYNSMEVKRRDYGI